METRDAFEGNKLQVDAIGWEFPGINIKNFVADGFLCWMLIGWERMKFYISLPHF